MKESNQWDDASCVNCIHKSICNKIPSPVISIPSFYDIAYKNWGLRRLDGDITSEWKEEFEKKFKRQIEVINKEYYHRIAMMCPDWQDIDRTWITIEKVYETRWDCPSKRLTTAIH